MKARLDNSEARLRQLNEAAEWVVRLGNTAPREEEVAEWLRWCDQVDGNLEAFEQLQGDWRDLGAVRIGRVSILKTKKRAALRWAGLAAALAIAAVGLTYWWERPPLAIALESASRSRSATLPDGSSLVLSARSALDINFTGRERRLSLNRGEGYFRVQHDARRPFVVQAGGLEVTAIGTIFDVRRDRDVIIVTVAEGSVGIVSDAGGESGRRASWQASAGYQLSYQPGARTASLVRVDPERVMGWHDGELAYVSAPISAVIDDINRYSDRHILVRDPDFARQTYSGTVFINSINDWTKALGAAYSTSVEESASGELVIGSPKKAPTDVHN